MAAHRGRNLFLAKDVPREPDFGGLDPFSGDPFSGDLTGEPAGR